MHDHVRVIDQRVHRAAVEDVAAHVGDLLPAALARVERPARHAHDPSHLTRALERPDHRLADLASRAGDRDRQALTAARTLGHPIVSIASACGRCAIRSTAPYAWWRARAPRVSLRRPERQLVPRRRRTVLLRPRGRALARAAARAAVLRAQPRAALARVLQQPARRLSGGLLPVAADLRRVCRGGRLQRDRPRARGRHHQAVPDALLDPRLALSDDRLGVLRRVRLRRLRRRARADLRVHPGRLPEAARLLETRARSTSPTWPSTSA